MFRRLAGLPPYGPLPRPFPREWGKSAHEGLVVEFERTDGSMWVGNFAPGIGGLDDVLGHPNGVDVLVASSGQLWQVSRDAEDAVRLAPAAFNVWSLSNPLRLLFSNQDIAFFCVGVEGVTWRTRRISWDGFRRIRINGDTLEGEAWSPDDRWIPFRVNLVDGNVVGGSYTGPEMTFDLFEPGPASE